MKKILVLILFSVLIVCSSNSQWQQVYTSSFGYRSLASFDNVIYAGSNGHGILRSTNNGANWLTTSLNGVYTVWGFAKIGNSIFAGMNEFGVYVSTNTGQNWTQTSLNDKWVYSLTAIGTDLYAGTTSYGVYKSTNNGVNWTQTSLNNLTVNALMGNGNRLLAGANLNGVRYTTNGGNNWTQSPLSGNVYTLTSIGNHIFAGASVNGIYISTNQGSTWTHSSYDSGSVFASTVSGNTVFAGTYNGVLVSNDYGATWTRRVEGMPSNLGDSRSMCIQGNDIFAHITVNLTHYIFKRQISELTAVSNVSNLVPEDFSLSQNYPNPFNPVTNIEFSIPRSAFVKLTVYDISGREVEVLLNQNMSSGTYKADWDASKYSSGIYFYTISSENFTETKKMILIK